MLWYGDSVLDVPIFKSSGFCFSRLIVLPQSRFVLFLHPISSQGRIIPPRRLESSMVNGRE
jgi:hypothetical protein